MTGFTPLYMVAADVVPQARLVLTEISRDRCHVEAEHAAVDDLPR
jgi:hypothetical protein